MKQKTFSDLTKHSIRASLLFLILLLFETNHSALYAQDTDFWFVAPQLSNSFYSPVFFSISNGTAMEAHVTITLYNGGSIETINRTIPAASSSKIDFISDVAMAKVQNPRALAGAVTQYGIHITSDVKVFAYYMINSSDSRDIYTLKGKQAVGTDFFVPIGPDGVKFINQITYTDAFDQIDIVATNDNTQVTVTPTAPVYIAATATPPAAAYTSPAGTPIVRTLNKGETLKIRANTQVLNAGNVALGGTTIHATDSIAVTVTEDLSQMNTSGNRADVAGDQLVPVSNLGRMFVLTKGYMQPAFAAWECVYIYATQDNTTLTIDGTAVATINTGQSYLYTFPATANASFLEASNPVYCYQRTGVNEQGAALIPSIFSISQNAISYYQVTSETKKAFVVFRSGTDTDFNITIDGVTNSLNIGTPYTISTITGWQVARFDLPNVNEKYITISNNKSIFSLGYFAANSSSNTMTSYGYLSQFGYFSFATDTLYKCPGSSVTLDGGYALSYLWTYPDGSTATTPTITTDMPGKYILQLDQNPTNVTDSIYVTDIYFNATISQSPQSADEVPGTPVTFSVNTADMSLINNVNLTYSWTFSGCTPASSSDPTPSVTWSDPGNRNVSLTLSYTTTNGSTCDTTLTYQINPQPIEAYALCGGVPTDIYFYPDNPGYTYYWYTQNPSSGGATATTGNPFSYTKGTSSVVDTLYVQVDDGVTLSGVNKVLAYLVPDTLIWNGATDRDWLNAANWTYPGSLDYTCSDCSIYKFPGYCTNVLIPSPQSLSPLTYPDLSPAATGYTTAIDNVAACNNIHFQSGAEVVRTDSLHYSKAYVDLTLEANRWYMLSAPLGNFYVGDIYQSNPNPFLDGYFIEPMYFNAPNPQTFQTASYSWTGRFHNADELLTAGKGVAIWTDEQGTDYTDHDPVTFSFPKSDTKYYYWSDATTAVGETGALSRTNKHRFIYEPLAAGGYVPLAASPCSDTEQPVLVGNPFMAHIALDKFLDDNVGQIYDGYKLAYGVNTGSDGKVNAFSTYKKISGVWYNTDPTDPNLSYLIAPMQSFIVISRVANPVLQVNIQSTSAYTSLNDGLRSAHASSNIKKLEILATRDEERCKILLLHLPEATNAYDPEEDSYQLFPESNRQSLQIYTRSSDGYALDINALNNLSEQISLGVYTSKEGAVTLHFSGMNEFNQTGFYLHDSQENKVIDLSLQNTYTFETVAGEGAYLENRFYLTTRPNAPTVIETAAKANISINNSGRNIEILSKDADSISSIEITNLQGVHLVNEKHLSVSHYHYTVNTPGIYIVKASGKYGAEVKKIIIK